MWNTKGFSKKHFLTKIHSFGRDGKSTTVALLLRGRSNTSAVAAAKVAGVADVAVTATAAVTERAS